MIRILQNLSSRYGHAYNLINIAKAYAQLADTAPALMLRAVETLNLVIESAQAMGDARAASYAFGHLGHLYEKAQRYDEALTLTHRAIIAAQGVHLPGAVYQWQWQSGRLLNALGNPDKAITAYALAIETLQTLRGELPYAYGRVHTDFRTSLGPLYFEFVDLVLRRAAAAQDPKRLTADLARAQQAIEQFKFGELQAFLGDDCIAARPQSTSLYTLEQLSAEAAQNAVIVYPMPLEDRTEFILRFPQGLARFSAEVSAERLESVATVFRDALQEGSERQYKKHAQQLYDWLIRPFAEQLAQASTQTLVFVPDGALRAIPFAALHDGQHYLIEQYALAITPGLQLTDPQPINRQRLKVLAVGVARPAGGFAPLQYVPQELAAIERLFKGRAELLPEFRRSQLEAAFADQQFGIVHIASHGHFAPNLEDSFLLTGDGAEVNKLTLSELEQMVRGVRYRDQPLELLTLSACETALGADRAALGLAGVAIQAGARSALATLWRVEDEVTATLMQTFYQYLLVPGTSRARALQQAQLHTLAQPSYADPASWAPFILINSWR